MHVNRMYFRGGKTTIISLQAWFVVLLILACSDVVSQTHPEQALGVSGTPDWAMGMVWYQIFPERFANGNPENDPWGWDLVCVEWDQPFGEVTRDEIESLWNRRLVDPRRFRSDPNRSGGVAMNTIYARRYGGDLLGVYHQLEELVGLGVTGIYLCPIFESRSLHKYDAWDHRHIDPTLGHPGVYPDPGPSVLTLRENEDPADESTWAWTPADRWFVDVFLPRAKSLGLRVVLDGVWNHTGLGHWAFQDVREHGESSEYSDWFETRFDENGVLIGWRGWDRNNGNLPVFQQSKGDLGPGPKAHMIAVTRRWMDPNGDGDPSDGIDGWRLDVANEVGRVFWKDWREQVKSLNPEALIIGEIWFDAEEYFDGTAFDGQMNYPAAYALADWLSIGGPLVGDGAAVAGRLERVFHHGADHDLVQMNLISSHDTERLVSLMFNDFERGFDQNARADAAGTEYRSGDVDPDAEKRSLMAIAAMVAMPGSVMVYNGDEYAMPGADDPHNRFPVQWGSWTKSNSDFHERVRWLLQLRSDPLMGETLRVGSYEFLSDNTGEGLIVRRTLGELVVEIQIGGSRTDRGKNGILIPESMTEWLFVRVVDG